MKKLFLCLSILLLYVSPVLSSTTDTLLVYSNSMKKNIKTVVVVPSSLDKKSMPAPVVYLLHGYAGNYSSWVSSVPEIKKLSDDYRIIIVCPDAENSWYFDSPVNPAVKYETFASKELIEFIDSKYNTIKSREGRAITGLSMGGHGALYLAIRHQDTFGAAGSMSGGVDIRPFPENWEIMASLGTIDKNRSNWENNTVVNMTGYIKAGSLAIIFDCGTEDFFIKVNRDLHDKLLLSKIPHEYTERPGQHNWEYWRNAVQYQLLYFKNFFH